MSYVSATSLNLTPDFFRKAALAYNANPGNRKVWLRGQIINLESVLVSYRVKMIDLMDRGAKLDGKSDAAQWMQAIGGVAVTIPTPYTMIGGAVLSVAGTIVSAFEKKKDSRALRELSGEARQIQIEAEQINNYYNNYKAELQKIEYTPIALFGAALFVILKK
jgi:hypothetical protein